MATKEKGNSYSHILKYTGLFGGVQGLGILVGIVRNKLVAMILGPEGMGLVSLFNSTVKLVADSTNFGLSMSAVKSISQAFDQGDAAQIERTVRVVRCWSLLTALLGTVLCVVLSPLLSRFTFSWNGHTLHFICLAPVVGLMAITGGEVAILKGSRRLRGLASISVANLLLALVISVPIYYFFGNAGIVASLVLMALAQAGITVAHSYRLFPLRGGSRGGLLREGYGMIRLGVAFVAAGMLGSGADFLIRSYLNNVADLEVVGLYNAGYMMTMTYVGMVFSAMETDYFPRLSGISHLNTSMRTMVNRQIEVMLLLVSPLLVAFMILLPILLPLLYTGKFMPVIGMMQLLVFAMYFRAVRLPIEYIPLAKGDSRSYLLLEGIYDVLLVVLVICGYQRFGLSGAGLGIAVAGIVDFFVVLLYARCRYAYKPSTNVVMYASLQIPIGLVAYVVTLWPFTWIYWTVGAMLFLASLTASLIILRSKTNLWQRLTAKVASKLHLK